MPPPSVKWYVDDSEIEESDEFRYETDGDKRILIFAEIFPEDSGTYTCVALNSVGEVKSKMKISVEGINKHLMADRIIHYDRIGLALRRFLLKLGFDGKLKYIFFFRN